MPINRGSKLNHEWEKQRATQRMLEKITKELYREEPLHTIQLNPHANDDCAHDGFVAREIEGDYKYICRECNKRFRRHPGAKSEILVSPVDQETLIGALGQFREGMTTITQALTQTRMSIEDFNEAMRACFPPQDIVEEMHHIGNAQSIPVRIGTMPQRTSCPKELDDYIHDPNVTLSELKDMVASARFADITEVSYSDDQLNNQVVYEFGFIDGTTQRVVVTPKDLMMKRSE